MITKTYTQTRGELLGIKAKDGNVSTEHLELAHSVPAWQRHVIIICVLCCFGFVVIGAIGSLQTMWLKASSLSVMRSTGLAIGKLEQETQMIMDAQTWRRIVRDYPLETQDPAYAKLVWPRTSSSPGWGVNEMLGFSVGDKRGGGSIRVSGGFVKGSIPENALLLIPSYETSVKPNIDGTLPKERLSEFDSTIVDHQNRIPSTPFASSGSVYLTVGGAAEFLTKEEATDRLRYVSMNSQKRHGLEATIIQTTQQIAFAENKNKALFANEYSKISQGSVETPRLSVEDKQGYKITFMVSAKTTAQVELQIIYYNNNNLPINIDANNKATRTKGILGGPLLYVDTEITTPLVGFNDVLGHAENVTSISKVTGGGKSANFCATLATPRFYAKNTRVVGINYPSIVIKDVGADWQELSIDVASNKRPKYAETVSLMITNKQKTPVYIKDVSVALLPKN